MSSTAGEMARKFQTAAAGIQGAERVGVTKACQAGKEVMLAALTGAARGRRLSRVGRSGARLGVNYRVFGTVDVVGTLRYTGPVHLLNNATKPHEERPKRKQALSPAGAPWAAASVEHPGTSGKHFAEKAEPVVIAQSGPIVTSEVHRSIARVF